MLRETTRKPKIVVVGCGGTGSLVAEGLCRLLINSDLSLLLVDPDRVEPHNLRRQNFFASDVGKFKSQALADRLARQYGRQIGYSVLPYEKDMFDEETRIGRSVTMSLIIIGCVDNTFARRSIANSIDWDKWWLDAGNGHHSGQVLLGNAKDIGELKEGFNRMDRTVVRLPIPSLQLPSLLIPPIEPATRQRDCAEAVEDDAAARARLGALPRGAALRAGGVHRRRVSPRTAALDNAYVAEGRTAKALRMWTRYE